MSTPNPAVDHVINDMYIVNWTSNPVHFIEAGIFLGCLGTDCSAEYNPRFFWGRRRAIDNQYAAYFGGVASMGTDYDDEVTQYDPTTWNVVVGPFTATSYSNALQASLLRAGLETTSPYATACASQSNLWYEDYNGTWWNGWHSSYMPNGNAMLTQYNPPWAIWMTQNQWVRDWSGSPDEWTTYSACWPGGLAGSGSSTAKTSARIAPNSSVTTSPKVSSASSATGPKLTAGQVSRIAQDFAAGMGGGANPSAIEHAESTLQQAAFALSGDDVPGGEDVYAIVMRGQFVANDAPRPSMAAAPSGSVLTLIIDATTGELTEFGVGNQVPNLTKLGPVTTDR